MVDDPILLDRFFVLSAVNLFAFRVTIFVSEAATERKFHGDFVFIALLVWLIVYLFSPNTLNPYFVYAIYGIMTLHFIFLLFSNFKVKAPLWEMLCIYVYFWVCLFPVITSTLSTIVLIPILLFAFVLVRSAPRNGGSRLFQRDTSRERSRFAYYKR